MKSARPVTVLSVDDSEIIYNMLGVVLSAAKNVNWLGHAFSLSEAHAQLEIQKPQVVILDIHLKEENSFGLLEHISKHFPDTIVIMLSNIATPPYRKRCSELGASYFLDKSIEFEKLSGVLTGLSVSV